MERAEHGIVFKIGRDYMEQRIIATSKTMYQGIERIRRIRGKDPAIRMFCREELCEELPCLRRIIRG